MTPQLVIGNGEVGSALAEILNCPVRDLVDNGDSGRVLHIAYPWSDSFIESTLEYESHYNADLIIVHSTVPAGTCDPHNWVHSPVRGRHPELVLSLKVFPKVFGGGGEKAITAAVMWPYRALSFPRAAECEAGKLWELVQFGLQVRITQQIYEWCIGKDLNPDLVYREFARQYNEGYAHLAPQFVRPILDYVPGSIGGHCITESAPLLDDPLADVVVRGF